MSINQLAVVMVAPWIQFVNKIFRFLGCLYNGIINWHSVTSEGLFCSINWDNGILINSSCLSDFDGFIPLFPFAIRAVCSRPKNRFAFVSLKFVSGKSRWTYPFKFFMENVPLFFEKQFLSIIDCNLNQKLESIGESTRNKNYLIFNLVRIKKNRKVIK